jgi:NAD(P)-dependent dehydrogenase (short-subunit alcohol dehydrogenase family)
METKKILLTGASTGIGRAAALLLAGEGYTVFAGIRRTEDAEALKNACPAEARPRLQPVSLDVTRPEDIHAALAAIDESSRDGLYAIVNNAGFNLNGAFEYTDEADARSLMDTNFFGLAGLSRAALPLLRRYAASHPGETAKLVNIGSIGSYIGVPWEAYYHASKFAVLGLSESMRHELWHERVRVVAICPGGIKTDFIPKTERSLAAAAAKLPKDAPESYRTGLAKLGEAVGMATRFGSEPEAVAQRLRKVLASTHPRSQYVVGTDARLFLGMRRLLPESWFHAVIRRQFAG